MWKVPRDRWWGIFKHGTHQTVRNPTLLTIQRNACLKASLSGVQVRLSTSCSKGRKCLLLLLGTGTVNLVWICLKHQADGYWHKAGAIYTERRSHWNTHTLTHAHTHAPRHTHPHPQTSFKHTHADTHTYAMDATDHPLHWMNTPNSVKRKSARQNLCWWSLTSVMVVSCVVGLASLAALYQAHSYAAVDPETERLPTCPPPNPSPHSRLHNLTHGGSTFHPFSDVVCLNLSDNNTIPYIKSWRGNVLLAQILLNSCCIPFTYT